MREGYVYFAKPANDIARVKIGWAVCPVRRIEDLSCGSTHPLMMLAHIKSDRKGERFLHIHFADEHRHREWYALSQRLKLTIRMIQGEDRDDLCGLERLREVTKLADNDLEYVDDKELLLNAPTIMETTCPQCNRLICPGATPPNVCAYQERLVRRGSQLYKMKLPKRRSRNHGHRLIV